MSEKTMFMWRITHPMHGAVVVTAPDRLRAVYAAAKAYGNLRWPEIARDLKIEKLGEAPRGKGGKA